MVITREQIEERIRQLESWKRAAIKRRLWPQVIAIDRELKTLRDVLKMMEV